MITEPADFFLLKSMSELPVYTSSPVLARLECSRFVFFYFEVISLQAHTCALFKSNGPAQYGPSIYCCNKLFMRAISRAAASFLEGIAVSQHSHVSADVSVHYIGQRRAYQAKTCSLSGPLPFVLAPSPPSITPSAHCHSSCWPHPPTPSMLHPPPPPTIRFNRVCARLRGPRAHVICHSN